MWRGEAITFKRDKGRQGMSFEIIIDKQIFYVDKMRLEFNLSGIPLPNWTNC